MTAINFAPSATSAFFLALSLSFITTVPAQATGNVDSQRLAGGEIRITCTGNPELCDQRAARFCSIGYTETSRKSDPANPDRLILTVRCD